MKDEQEFSDEYLEQDERDAELESEELWAEQFDGEFL